MKAIMTVMDSSGDSRVEFDTEVKDASQDEARALFSRLTAAGARAFRTDGNDAPVKNFDDVQGEVLMVPRIVGG